VEPTHVRDLWGTVQHEGATKGIMITTSGYGPDSYKFADGKPLNLIDGSGLLALCQEYKIAARILNHDKRKPAVLPVVATCSASTTRCRHCAAAAAGIPRATRTAINGCQAFPGNRALLPGPDHSRLQVSAPRRGQVVHAPRVGRMRQRSGAR